MYYLYLIAAVVLFLFVILPALLTVLYVVGIQYQREGWPDRIRNFCYRVAQVGYICDLLFNYTSASAYLWQRPQPGEYTLSKRLNRLILDTGWRGVVCRPLARFLNRVAPNHDHIKGIIA